MLSRSVVRTCLTASKQPTQVSPQSASNGTSTSLLEFCCARCARSAVFKSNHLIPQIARSFSLLTRAASSKRSAQTSAGKSQKSTFTINWTAKKSPTQLYFGSFIQKSNYTTASGEFEFYFYYSKISRFYRLLLLD